MIGYLQHFRACGALFGVGTLQRSKCLFLIAHVHLAALSMAVYVALLSLLVAHLHFIWVNNKSVYWRVVSLNIHYASILIEVSIL